MTHITNYKDIADTNLSYFYSLPIRLNRWYIKLYEFVNFNDLKFLFKYKNYEELTFTKNRKRQSSIFNNELYESRKVR